MEEQRRARIVQMQRLYGLAAPEDEEERQGLERTEEAGPPQLAQRGERPASRCSELPAAQEGPPRGLTPDMDRALSRLQDSMSVHEADLRPQAAAGPSASEALGCDWPLPPLLEDPLSQSQGLGDSGGLIAWSRNLRPDALSPEATLASFFPTPVL